MPFSENTPRPARSSRNRLLMLVSALPLLLAGCAGDAWRSESSYDAYLDRVQKHCEGIRIGGRLIDEPLFNDPYFLDITSRFFNGRISQPEFVDALTSFYNAKDDSPGIACLLQQMPNRDAPPQMNTPPVIVK